MRVKACLASFCGLLLPVLTSVATAAGPDLRLVDAVARQDTRAVRALLKEGVDVNTPRADGASPLLWAAHWDDLETADLLLRAGANVNAADDHGVTALARACENASVPMVEKLLAAAANVNVVNFSGLTPLMTAARTGNVNVVKALIARGATVNAETTETKQTALIWAVAEGHLDIVRTLTEAGADVHASGEKGFTPLMFAARNGDIETAKVLLAAGARVNDTGPEATHPLPLAIMAGHDEFALFLLEQGADPNGALFGVHALHAAAGSADTWLRPWIRTHGGRGLGRLAPSRRLPLVKALLARGADPNARIATSVVANQGFVKNGAFDNFAVGTGDLGGATALWVAAYSANGGGAFGGLRRSSVDSSGEILSALLAAGADHRLRTDDGTTPLMVAAGCGRFTYTPRTPRAPRSPSAEDAVRILVEEAGTDVNAVNEADFTALHCAAYGGLNEVVQYLVDHGSLINARDWRGRTPFRLAEGAKQSFQFQDWPETAELLRKLGANTSLGIPGTIQERLREVAANQ